MKLEQIKEMLNSISPIPSYPDYGATPCGKIFSLKSNWRGYGVRQLKTEFGKNNYLMVRFKTNKNKRRRISVHTLICETFHGVKPTNSHQTRHLDGDKLNNHYLNLKWGTAKENNDDKKKHGVSNLGKRWKWSKNGHK